MDQQKERKARLSKIRERTKVLLRNHDWEKYYPTSSEINFGEDEISLSLAAAATAAGTNNNHLNCSLSAINHLDYDSLLMQTNTQHHPKNIINIQNNNNNNNTPATINNANDQFQLELIPYFINTSSSSKKTISKETAMKQKRLKVLKFKTPKRITPSCDEDSDDANYQLNLIPQGRRPSHETQRQSQIQQHQRRLVHHQSLTFIADLAQTSTPTRVSVEPITSTPKQITHDPLKYHPTQTIRSKKPTATAAITAEVVTSSSTRRLCCPSSQAKSSLKRDNAKCMQCMLASAVCNGGRLKRKRTESISIVEHGSNEWDCNLCNLSRAVSSIGETAMAVATMGGHVAVSSSCTNKKKSRGGRTGVKLVKMSNVEISLQDLLYVPTKASKFDFVTTSRPRVVRKQQSKVYYL